MKLPISGIIKMGGISLCDNLLLRGLRAPRVAVDAQRTKGGVTIGLVNRLSGGRQLELYGEYTTALANQLQALEGQDIPLIHPKRNFTVMIIGNTLQLWRELTTADDDDIEEGSFILLER